MAVKSLARSGLVTYSKYSSMHAGNTPILPGAYELLETQILTGNQATITFSNLNSTYGSTYQHLQLRVVARTNRSGQVADLGTFFFNGDETLAGGNYNSHALTAGGSTVTSSYDAVPYISYYAAANATANKFTAFIMDILDPFETTKFTTTRLFLGQGESDRQIGLESGLWRNTAALTSLKLDVIGDFVTGSRFSLYGLRSS
jgi:hypothetical protein